MKRIDSKQEIAPLSSAVHELRFTIGQTQQQFAQTIKTAITTIARWETTRPPKGKWLIRLALTAQEHGLEELSSTFREAALKPFWKAMAFEPRSSEEAMAVNCLLKVMRARAFPDTAIQCGKAIKSLSGAYNEVIALHHDEVILADEPRDGKFHPYDLVAMPLSEIADLLKSRSSRNVNPELWPNVERTLTDMGEDEGE
jgi:DNA-binding XRE family transcriptional regulator